MTGCGHEALRGGYVDRAFGEPVRDIPPRPGDIARRRAVFTGGGQMLKLDKDRLYHIVSGGAVILAIRPIHEHGIQLRGELRAKQFGVIPIDRRSAGPETRRDCL
jgi:hypothetical protein